MEEEEEEERGERGSIWSKEIVCPVLYSAIVMNNYFLHQNSRKVQQKHTREIILVSKSV